MSMQSSSPSNLKARPTLPGAKLVPPTSLPWLAPALSRASPSPAQNATLTFPGTAGQRVSFVTSGNVAKCVGFELLGRGRLLADALGAPLWAVVIGPAFPDVELQRLIAEARVEARRNLLALDAALAKDGTLLAAEERATIDEARARLEAAIAGDDRDEINAAAEALEALSKPFAERRMDRGIRDALSGLSVGELESRVGE